MKRTALLAVVCIVALALGALAGVASATESLPENMTTDLPEKPDNGGLYTTGAITNKSDNITVVFETSGASAESLDVLEDQGAAVQSRYEDRIQAKLQAKDLSTYRNLSWVDDIRQPYTGAPDVVSEGVAAINADDAHADGITGQNVKIGVLDGEGFNLGNLEISSNVAGYKSFKSSGGIEDGGTHGTAVAEVAVDVAPDSELYLANYDTGVEYANAVDWMGDQDVDVIILSWSWFLQPYDGDGFISEVADDAVEQDGIVLTNSAGNYANGHWRGTFNNPDGDEWLNFEGADERNYLNGGYQMSAGDEAWVTLNWNDWPDSDQDYDLYLYRDTEGDDEVIASSEDLQTGSQEPTEIIRTTVPESGRYYVAIGIRDASAPQGLEMLFIGDGATPDRNHPEGSIVAPAVGNEVTAVGAFDYGLLGGLKGYSSRGPTKDGRTGVDVVAPTDVSNSARGTFGGTSAAAPHVGGTAALVLAANPNLSPQEVEQRIESAATDIREPGVDVDSGHGKIDALSAIQGIQQGIQVSNYEICTDIRQRNSGVDDCPPDETTDNIQSTDERAISWMKLNNVDSAYDITWKFYEPSGSLFKTIEATHNEDGDDEGTFSSWGWIDVNGQEAATIPGEWSVDVSIEGIHRFTDTFTIEEGSGGENDRFEPNDDRSSATSITPGSYEDLQIVNGESDYFELSLDEGDELTTTIQFSHDTGDLDLELQDSGGTGLEDSISTTDDETITYTIQESGVYYVRAYGYAGASAPYDLDVSVGGSGGSPTASFSFTPSNPQVGETITFDATSSSDPDGSIQSYEWEFDDGETMGSKTESQDRTGGTADSDGTTRLEEKQGIAGETSEDTKVESASRGSGDTADADTIRESGKYASSDTTTTETGEVVSHAYSNSGTYTVSLTVTDDDGRTDTTTETVTVSPNGEAEAAVESSDVTVGGSFETGESSITMDAEDGVSVANIEVSVDASVAEISNVEPGTDVDENNPSVAFSVEDQGSGSVRIEYSNIQATDSSVTDFELATVELESQTDGGEADIGVTPDGVFSGNQNEYIPVEVEEGTLTVGTLFGSPLPGFENPPTNTGEIDPTLYEDVDGDSDGMNPVQSVNLWSQLITSPEEFDDLSQEQIDALDWNGDGELTPTDAVTLWSEQVQAGG